MHRSAILRRLGSISVKQFMREAWQRKPMLIRDALPDFAAPIDRVRLFELARDPAAESRLITRSAGRWSLQHGPFRRLPSLRHPDWTLLVQGVDLHDDSARDLMSRFRFVPDARLDDLMVSYATDGGGVGPHVDSYDVFLLQASGRRRWRISRQRRLALQRGSPLSVVAGFRASHEWVLDAGDMLYLPPGVAHEGVALGECLTYSIGFRSPSYQQLLEPWFATYSEHTALRGRYADPGVSPTERPAALPTAMAREIHAKLTERQPAVADTERFLLQHLSEPKATTTFSPPSPLPLAQWRRRAGARGLELNRKSRMIYANTALGINGEWIKPPPNSMAIFRKLADRRALAAHEVANLSNAGWTLMHDWYTAGWIKIAD